MSRPILRVAASRSLRRITNSRSKNFGDRPAIEVVKELQVLLGANTPGTDRALAQMILTSRNGMKAFEIPHGPVTIETKSKDSGITQRLQLTWDYTPERISDAPWHP